MFLLKLVGGLIGVGLLIFAALIGFSLYKINVERPATRSVLEDLLADVRAHDESSAKALIAEELLRQHPDIVSILTPTINTIASIADYSQWYVGGANVHIGAGEEKYTYDFIVNYNDGTTGKGIVKLVKRTGAWKIYDFEIIPGS